MNPKPSKNLSFRARPYSENQPSASRSGNQHRAMDESHDGLLVPLTPGEQERFSTCEEVLRAGLGTFFDVGAALITIREGRLHRTTHPTFERYCRERWGIGRSYACRLIGSALRLNLLPANYSAPRPCSEFQIRPFLSLSPEAFPKAWEEAIRRAENGKMTPTLVRALIAELSPAGQTKTTKAKRSQRLTYPEISRGAILVLLHEAKRQAEKGDAGKVVEVLERIESLIYTPSGPGPRP
jgi:hypothetical protein